MKKVGIVGYGYVGKAMYNFFKDNYDVVFYDPNVTGSCNREEINDCGLALVCVPTPPDANGYCDTSIVEECVSWITSDLIIIKSTVEVGTTDYLKRTYNNMGRRIVFSPEYCGESSYWSPYKFHTDVKETPFFIFGGDEEDTSLAIDWYIPVTGPTKVYHQTKARVAEMAKYMENCFYATKIAFCKEMYSICEAEEIEWSAAREAWLLDPRINPMHTAVFKDKRGFSGKCLPKDVSALISMAENKGISPHLLKGVEKSNEESKKSSD